MNVILVRAGYALLLALAGLGFKPWLSDHPLPGSAVLPELNLLRPEAGTLCAGDCTCSYCDQVINGRCYTNGRRGYGLCTTGCDTDSCNFRPNVDGCGPILYLGCDDDDCRGTPLPVPSPTKDRIIIIGPLKTPTPQPTPRPTPAPTATPGSGPSVCQPPLEVDGDGAPANHRGHAFTAVPGPANAGVRTGGRPHRVLSCQCQGRPGPRPCQAGETGLPRCRQLPPGLSRRLDGRLRNLPEGHLQRPGRGSLHQPATVRGLPRLDHRLPAIPLPKGDRRQPTSSGGTWTGSTMGSAVDLSGWQPKDPGVHEGTARLLTQGTAVSPPQSVQLAHSVEVHLRDTTLTK